MSESVVIFNAITLSQSMRMWDPYICFPSSDALFGVMLSDTSSSTTDPATIIFTLPIHDQGVDPYRCGALRPAEMLKALAYIYGIHGIRATAASRRFDLRVLILDNCDNVLRIDQDLFNLLKAGTLCNTEFNPADGSRIDASSVLGVHTISSRFVVAANRVTAPMKIQLMSSSASASSLADTRVYPYFARTAPPDTLQMAVIARLLERNGWRYVSVLYSQEPYGINGYRDLRDLTRNNGYSCIGFSEALRDIYSKPLIKEALGRLDETEGSRVIVLIVGEGVRNVLEAIIEMGLADKYVLIGSDSWGTNTILTDDIWRHFRGALTVNPRDAFHTGFLQWMSDLTFTNRLGIPDSWFEEFYQRIHRCQLFGSPYIQKQFTRLCTEDLVIEPEMVKEFGIGLREIAAAYAVDQGLERLRCNPNARTFAECLADVENAREKLFEYTLAVDWEMPILRLEPQEVFRLTLGEKRYWDAGYNIYTIKEDNMYELIGTSGDDFFFNTSAYSTYKGDSFVSRCPVNQYCDCNFDDETEPVAIIQSVLPRTAPRNYFMYKDDGENSSPPERLYTWPVWAIAVAVLSCIGIVMGLILFFYFLVAYPIRGGTTVLGFMMMIGVFGIYAINFAFFMPASAATCGARAFVMGVVYAIVFAALLIKSIDNWRFRDVDYRAKQYYRGISNPCLLITLALGIVLIQCIIPIEWLVLEHPSASLMADASVLHDWMRCDPHDFFDISLVLSMSFVAFLVLLTAVFAALAWNSESNYYESRWIFVSCVCTAGCFLVWMVVSTNAGPPYRDPAVAIANFVNATALLVFIPIRKLVLLIQFKSEEEKYKMSNGLENSTDRELYSTVYPNQAYESDISTVDRKTIPADEY